jgi:hypothetical protein
MDMDLDSQGNIYVIGLAGRSPDLDPGPARVTGGDSQSDFTTCLIKLDKDGNYLWGHTWAGMEMNTQSFTGDSVCCDSEGNCYTAGCFEGAVGSSDEGFGCYLVKFDADGNEMWRFKYEPPVGDMVPGSDCLYLAGMFYQETDFDPGPGTDSGNSGPGGYLVKLDSDGKYQWVHVFPTGGMYTSMYGVDLDSKGNVYVVGAEMIDDGTPMDDRNYWGALHKMSPEGDEIWSKRWAGDRSECFALCVEVNSNDEVFVGGTLSLPELGMSSSTVDLNPGEGTDAHVIHEYDVYLSKFDTEGNFKWAGTWGGHGTDWIRSIESGDNSSVLVLGSFSGTVDFDPGPGSAQRSSHAPAAFLLEFE